MPHPQTPPALIAALTLGVAAVGGSMFSFSPLLPDVAAAFDVPVTRAASMTGVFSVALALVAPVVGLLSQRLPRARVIVAGLAAFGLAWLSSLLVTGFAGLLVATALAGAAGGAALPATYAIAADLASPSDRAKVMGRIVSGWSLAILAVVPAMALAAQHIGWRWSFGALAVLALASAAAIARLAPRPGEAPAGAAADGALVHDVPPCREAAGAAAARAGLVAGLRADLARVLGDRPVLLVLSANLLNMGAFYAVYAFLGTGLRRANDWGATPAGLVVACYGLGLAIVTFNAGLIDRWGHRRAAIGALLALVLVLAALPWLVGAPAAMVAGVIVWGCVQGTFFTAITTLATEQIPSMRGVVTAMLSCATYVGVTLYTPVAAALHAGPGYPAVGMAAGFGCALGAWLLSRLPYSRSAPA